MLCKKNIRRGLIWAACGAALFGAPLWADDAQEQAKPENNQVSECPLGGPVGQGFGGGQGLGVDKCQATGAGRMNDQAKGQGRGQGQGQGRGQGAEHFKQVIEELELDANQKVIVQTTLDDLQKEKEGYVSEMKSLQEEMNNMRGNENPDRERLIAIGSRMGELKVRMGLLFPDFFEKINPYLTPEQQDKLTAIKANARNNQGKMGKRGGMRGEGRAQGVEGEKGARRGDFVRNDAGDKKCDGKGPEGKKCDGKGPAKDRVGKGGGKN